MTMLHVKENADTTWKAEDLIEKAVKFDVKN